MNILLVFPGFIIAFVIVFYYERKIRNLSTKPKNNVHFYVAKDYKGNLFLYLVKPIRLSAMFIPSPSGCVIESEKNFSKYRLNPDNFNDLKWEDEPVEVFLNLED